jgi:hypothetical protein
MEFYRWRTRPDGFIEVDQRDGQGFRVIDFDDLSQTSDLAANQGHPSAKHVDLTLTYLPIAQRASAKYGVPVWWILGTIYGETGGQNCLKDQHGAGVMAISRSHGFTDAELCDPEVSIDYGTKLHADSIKIVGPDFVRATSRYNAGMMCATPGAPCYYKSFAPTQNQVDGTTPQVGFPYPSVHNRWGVKDHPGHLDRLVRSHNHFRGLLPATVQPPAPSPPLPAHAPETRPVVDAGKVVLFLVAAGASYLLTREVYAAIHR